MVKISSHINYKFIYSGGKNFEEVNNEVIRLNEELEKQGFPFIVTKRIYSISIELLYNIVYHGIEDKENLPNIKFEITSTPSHITLKSSNYIDYKETENLRKVIDDLNNKSFDELRKMKAHQIKNGGISEKGGAGLGLIDIRMKSQNPISVNLTMDNKKIDWLTFEVKVDLV